MEHLDVITVEELQGVLDNVDGKKPTQRHLAAIASKNGASQIELVDWWGVERKKSIIGLNDSMPSRLYTPLLMLLVLGERESSSKGSNKNSNNQCVSHRQKSTTPLNTPCAKYE